MRDNIYVGLVHYPVYNKNNAVVATSVTNFDIHDISRTCRTYDIKKYFIITPVDAQKELTGRIIGYWTEGNGIEFNKNRNEAFENTELETLGFSGKSIGMLEKVLERKFGLILVSGPTGSGKSTTLLSIIDILNDGKRKIITVEDPVETKVKGLVQIQVNEEIGVTFPEVLKSTLRNDPDIIVVSEIRDEITAEIAVRAALTGHLVISTIHTNDAVSTLIRLTDMGIPKYLVLDSLVGVIAQRLVGKKCSFCGGEGCGECSGGYRGRISINEVLILGDEVKNILKSENLGRKSKEDLKRNAEEYFVDFDGDIKDKLSKNMIFEKDVYEFMD